MASHFENTSDTLSEPLQIIARQEERSTERDVYRIASLLCAVSYAQMRAMGERVLDGVFDDPANPLEFWAHECIKPMAEEPLAEIGLEKQKRTFFSITNCVSVVAWNTAWLAHLVEDSDVELVERSFHDMKPVREVVLCEDDETTLVKDFKHTVLVLKSKSSGESIVADPSFGQYGFESGIEMLEDYSTEKVHMNLVSEPFKDHKFGTATSWQDSWDDTLFLRAKTAITSRTAENVIIDQIQSMGGKEAFFSMQAAEFQWRQEEMVEIVYVKELEQRQNIENADHLLEDDDNGDELYADKLRALVEDGDRVGHQTCARSLERYIGPGADALDIPS